MSLSSRPFVTLPEVVLLEILGYLLIDTPCSPNRAAVLGTCSALYELGISLLYRVVDILALKTERKKYTVWTTLFGPQGLLTENGRVKDLCRSVRELRIGGEGGVLCRNFEFDAVRFPRCSSLALDATYALDAPLDPVRRFLFTLPVRNFSFSFMSLVRPDSVCATNSFGQSSPRSLFYTSEQPWPDLETIHMPNTLWFEEDPRNTISNPSSFIRRIAFSEWSFKTLVVDLATCQDFEDDVDAKFFELFLDAVDAPESDEW